MKKSVFIILVVLLTIGCAKKQKSIKIDDPELDKLKSKYNDVVKVKAIKYGIGGRVCYDVTEYKENIYESLINMKIIEQTDEIATDNGLSFLFILKDNSYISFSFSIGNYIKGQNSYKIEKTNYEIKYDKEVECE